MKIIAVTNRKGGVGKTTVATHIAAGLATLGQKVGLIDTDSQGHAALSIGMPKENGLYALMVDELPIEKVVRYVPPEKYSTAERPATGQLWLVPSSHQTYKIPHVMEEGGELLFLQQMEDFATWASLDTIIIDTNPSLSKLDGAIWLATDGFVYVTETNGLSFDGVSEAVQQMARFSKLRQRQLHRDTRVLGIVPNKFRAGTKLHRNNIADLAAGFRGLVWTPIPLSVKWEEAVNDVNHRQTMYTYLPMSGEAAAAWELVEMAGKAINTWAAV